MINCLMEVCQEAFNRRLPLCCYGSVRKPLALINSWIFRNLEERHVFPSPGLRNPGISFISFSLWWKVPSSLFNRDRLVFCKSGILIFIFAENNYSIYAHAMLIKTPLLHQSFGPRVFLSFFLYLCYFWMISWSMGAGCVIQGILDSLLLSLSHHRLWTTRFRSIKGPTDVSCDIFP